MKEFYFLLLLVLRSLRIMIITVSRFPRVRDCCLFRSQYTVGCRVMDRARGIASSARSLDVGSRAASILQLRALSASPAVFGILHVYVCTRDCVSLNTEGRRFLGDSVGYEEKGSLRCRTTTVELQI